MDEIAKYNKERWRALAAANALYTRPRPDLDEQSARELVDPDGTFGDVSGKRVLCLAGGGGRQSAAFGLLGAEVTVVDLSPEQLERDHKMAQHYKLTMSLKEGDMRDLLALTPGTFDIVYQPYSINFVPDAEVVFGQVRRVLKANGIYDFMCANPFAAGMGTGDWNGIGYTVKMPYLQGQRVEYQDEAWVYNRTEENTIVPPVEYLQTLSKLINGLILNGFILQGVQEIMAYDTSIQAEPGTWEHFTAVVPPWLKFRAQLRPNVFER